MVGKYGDVEHYLEFRPLECVGFTKKVQRMKRKKAPTSVCPCNVKKVKTTGAGLTAEGFWEKPVVIKTADVSTVEGSQENPIIIAD